MSSVQAGTPAPQDQPEGSPRMAHPALAIPFTVPAPRAVPDQRTLWIPPGPGWTPEQLKTELGRLPFWSTDALVREVMAGEVESDALADAEFDPHAWSGRVLDELLTGLLDPRPLLSELTAASKRSSDAGYFEAAAWEATWSKKVQRISVARESLVDAVPTKAVRKPAGRRAVKPAEAAEVSS